MSEFASDAYRIGIKHGVAIMERVAENEDTLEGLLEDLMVAEHIEAQIWRLRLDQAGVPPARCPECISCGDDAQIRVGVEDLCADCATGGTVFVSPEDDDA